MWKNRELIVAIPPVLLTAVLMALRVLGFIDWSFAWIMSPIWIMLIMLFLAVCLMIIIGIKITRKE